MNRSTGLKFGSANNADGKIKRKPSSVDKSGKKQGLLLPMQNSDTALGHTLVQRSFSNEAKSAVLTSAQEPLTSGQVRIL